jgi:hypothetical protein
MFASLRVSTGGACFRRRRLHARVPSCCHVGAAATNHVRARWAIRLSTIAQARHVAVLRVSAFSVQTTGPRRDPASARSLLAEQVRGHHRRRTSASQGEIACGDPIERRCRLRQTTLGGALRLSTGRPPELTPRHCCRRLTVHGLANRATFRRDDPRGSVTAPIIFRCPAPDQLSPTTVRILLHEGISAASRLVASSFRRTPPPLRQHDVSDHLAMILDATPRNHAVPSARRQSFDVPPRHHVPCSSFDDHARARLTSTIQGLRLSTVPYMIVARAPSVLAYVQSPTPHACERPSCDDSSYTGSLRRDCARPAIRRMFACLSTLIRVCRTAPLGPCTSSDAHVRARWAMRAFWARIAVPCVSASRSAASGSARIFRPEHQACSTAFTASRRSPMPFDICSHRRPLHRLSPALCTGHLRADLAISRSSSSSDRADRSASLDAHDPPALPCSRSRMFSFVSAPRSLDRFAVLRASTHVSARGSIRRPFDLQTSRSAANTLTARVHIQRIVIEKVRPFPLGQSHPARASEPSDQISESTELLPYSRELSSTRLAAHPNR